MLCNVFSAKYIHSLGYDTYQLFKVFGDVILGIFFLNGVFSHTFESREKGQTIRRDQ